MSQTQKLQDLDITIVLQEARLSNPLLPTNASMACAPRSDRQPWESFQHEPRIPGISHPVGGRCAGTALFEAIFRGNTRSIEAEPILFVSLPRFNAGYHSHDVRIIACCFHPVTPPPRSP